MDGSLTIGYVRYDNGFIETHVRYSNVHIEFINNMYRYEQWFTIESLMSIVDLYARLTILF